MSKLLLGIGRQIEEGRANLISIQNELSKDKMNKGLIQKEKERDDELIKLNEIEEAILRQKTKVDWIRLPCIFKI